MLGKDTTALKARVRSRRECPKQHSIDVKERIREFCRVDLASQGDGELRSTNRFWLCRVAVGDTPNGRFFGRVVFV